MPEKIKALFVSRRFWVTLGSIAVVLVRDKLNENLGLSLSDNDIMVFVLAVGTWVVGDSLKDTK